MTEVILKPVTPDAQDASISHWHFEEGDKVEKGQDLVEINCDGVIYNLPAPASGTLVEVYYDAGETAEIGEVIAAIEEE